MLGAPNVFAYAALFLFIPLTLAFYARFPATKATIATMMVGVLFLPEVLAVDPPLLPPMDKTSITAGWAFVGCLWKARARVRRAKPFRGIDRLFVVLLLCNVGTAVSNPEPLITGPIVRQGLTLYDSLALGIKDTLSMYLPFFVGRAMFTDRRALRALLEAIVVWGVVYVFLTLIEIRLSPQLHHWIYGYHQMDFSMAMRFGGYRPMVFMRTGLAVGMFMLSATLAAIALRRTGRAKAMTPWVLGIVLVLCKSLGAIVYGLVTIPLVALVKRPHVRLPALLALLALLYPVLRTADLFPADALVAQAEKFDAERALSLWFRFDQEHQLLQRALEKPWFGWGGYDRNRLFDPVTGQDLSVTDGDWAIQIGVRGLVGFVAEYGMLTIPVIQVWLGFDRIRERAVRLQLATFALITSLLVVDLLPNGLFHLLPFFFSGVLAGLLPELSKSTRRAPDDRGRRRDADEIELEGARISSIPPRPAEGADIPDRPAHGAAETRMLQLGETPT